MTGPQRKLDKTPILSRHAAYSDRRTVSTLGACRSRNSKLESVPNVLIDANFRGLNNPIVTKQMKSWVGCRFVRADQLGMGEKNKKRIRTESRLVRPSPPSGLSCQDTTQWHPEINNTAPQEPSRPFTVYPSVGPCVKLFVPRKLSFAGKRGSGSNQTLKSPIRISTILSSFPNDDRPPYGSI